MTVLVVANPKGGVGKSTLSTQIAGYWASRGHAVMLGDADPQQSSRLWLRLRPPGARPISGWEVDAKRVAKAPKGTTHVVLDTAAGVRGKALENLLGMADKLLVPVQPSIFDIYATRDFLDEVLRLWPKGRAQLALVGMRVDGRTLAAEQLQGFVSQLGLPVLGHLRPTQNYVHLAAQGLSLFDISPARVERDLAQWAPICQWLEA